MSAARRRHKKRAPAPTFDHEEAILAAGYSRIAGVDEAGRGCLAGPVVAAAVVLPERLRVRGVRDSKALSRAERERLADRIGASAVSIGYGICSAHEIDRLNILRASLEAMRRALSDLIPPPDFALVDGNQLIHPVPFPQRTVVHGDAVSHTIAAASILAKVKRDAIMDDLDDRYPGYGFGEHKGYATASHISAIETLGPAECHRQSFRLGTTSEFQAGLFEND